MEKRRVVVTGLSVISPVGNTVNDFWVSLLEGRSGASRVACFDPSPFSSHFAAEVKNFDPAAYFNSKDVRKTDRFVQFAVAAAKHAMEDCAMDLKAIDPTRAGVIIGSGIGGLHTIEAEHKKYLEKGPEKGPGRYLLSLYLCLS
jgi:3-oxoacyl-[acyl-carrier-protein] synthase II